MNDLLNSLIPAAVTVLGNILFYYFIKGRIQNSLEQKKIIFQGLFSEKIKINRELLEKINKISAGISMFSLNSDIEDITPLRNYLRTLTHYTLVNQPFWSTNTLNKLNELLREFDEILKLYSDYVFAKEESNFEEFPTCQQVEKRYKPFFDEIYRNPTYNNHINDLVYEMREDMRVNVFNKNK